MAAPKKLSAGQIINQLCRAEVALANGKRVKQVCRELGVSEQTYYRWRKEYGGMKVSIDGLRTAPVSDCGPCTNITYGRMTSCPTGPTTDGH